MSAYKVKIHYGIFGGERLGPRLRRAFRKAGYDITRREADADIIVGHSAGCFWLPAAPTHQKLVLIDPPYWPGKTISERGKKQVKENLKFYRHGYRVHQWLRRSAWGSYYMVRDVRRTRRIVKRAKTYDLATIVRGHTVLLIRNKHDTWLTPELEHLQQLHSDLRIETMPGAHDDWYHHPQPYVDLIKSVYGTSK